MIYAATPEEIEIRRKAFIRKWRLKHRAVADSLEEAGERLFTFTRLPASEWRVRCAYPMAVLVFSADIVSQLNNAAKLIHSFSTRAVRTLWHISHAVL